MDYSLESNQLFGSAFDDVSMGYMPDPGMVSCGMEMTPGVGGNCIATGSTSFVSISREVTDARLYDETEWYGGEPSDAAYARLQGRPGTTPMGQYVPVGDGIIPLLWMAALLAVALFVRQRRKSV